MKLIYLFSSLLLLSTSCFRDNNSPKQPELQKSLASYESGRENENPIISIEPSENVTLDDYREEANSIESEAKQILSLGENLNCKEASGFAHEAFLIAEKTSKSESLSEAEYLIGEAGEILQNAESALAFCQEQTE